MMQPSLGLHGYQSSELQFAEQAQQVQADAGNPPGAVTHQAPEQARASASAMNSAQPVRQAGNTEDVDTQPFGSARLLATERRPSLKAHTARSA